MPWRSGSSSQMTWKGRGWPRESESAVKIRNYSPCSLAAVPQTSAALKRKSPAYWPLPTWLILKQRLEKRSFFNLYSGHLHIWRTTEENLTEQAMDNRKLVCWGGKYSRLAPMAASVGKRGGVWFWVSLSSPSSQDLYLNPGWGLGRSEGDGFDKQ